jgi:hypothetical protein
VDCFRVSGCPAVRLSGCPAVRLSGCPECPPAGRCPRWAGAVAAGAGRGSCCQRYLHTSTLAVAPGSVSAFSWRYAHDDRAGRGPAARGGSDRRRERARTRAAGSGARRRASRASRASRAATTRSCRGPPRRRSLARGGADAAVGQVPASTTACLVTSGNRECRGGSCSRTAPSCW